MRSRGRNRRRPFRRWLFPAMLGALVEGAGTWMRSGQLAGDIVVRCRRGHVFTTIWIPAVSLKSLRLGWWRYQYCPVGRHWSLVTPIRATGLSGAQRQEAATHHDIRLP